MYPNPTTHDEYDTENKFTLFIHTLAVMFICTRKTNKRTQTPRVSRAFTLAFQLDIHPSIHPSESVVVERDETRRTTRWTRRDATHEKKSYKPPAHPPPRAIARTTRRPRARRPRDPAVLSTRIARRDPPNEDRAVARASIATPNRRRRDATRETTTGGTNETEIVPCIRRSSRDVRRRSPAVGRPVVGRRLIRCTRAGFLSPQNDDS